MGINDFIIILLLSQEIPYTQNKRKRLSMKKIIAGIGGLGLIIFIHECGHLFFAKLYNVAAPIFSIGFGPTLASIPLGNTSFQIALFPFGGYVELNQESLAQQPYYIKVIIMLGGIIFNILFAYAIMGYFILQKKKYNFKTTISRIIETTGQKQGIVGPIGIINLLGISFINDPHLFWCMIALISFNVGLFNLIPFPFFDGGKIALYTIEALSQKTIPESSFLYFSILFFIILLIFITLISIQDIKKWYQK